MATNAEYLSRVPLFASLDQQTLDSFGDKCVRKKLERSEALFYEGSEGGALYVVLGGQVRIEKVTASGVQVLGTRGPGEVIGEMSLIDGQPRSAQAVAASECKLLVLYRSDFESLVRAHPSASLAIMTSLSLRLREAADLLVARETQAVGERLLSHLTRLSGADGVVHLRLGQSELAETLGCARESLNRALNGLVRSGSIVKEGPKQYRIV